MFWFLHRFLNDHRFSKNTPNTTEHGRPASAQLDSTHHDTVKVESRVFVKSNVHEAMMAHGGMRHGRRMGCVCSMGFIRLQN